MRPVSQLPYAVYRHYDAEGALLYVGMSKAPADRFYVHRSCSPWATQTASITLEWFPDKRAALDAEARAILAEKPRHNVDKAVHDAQRGKKAPPTTDLGYWLEERCIAHAEMARRLECSHVVFSRIVRGIRRPDRWTAMRIEQETGGAIPASSWARERVSA